MTLALVYEKMQDYPKARDAYEKLLSINPDFVVALNNLAYLYTEQLNNLDKAYELARKARDLQGPGRGNWRYLRLGSLQTRRLSASPADSAGECAKSCRQSGDSVSSGHDCLHDGPDRCGKGCPPKSRRVRQRFSG